MLLIPTEQFVHFLDTINAHLGINLTIPDGGQEKYFEITFPDNCPQPRCLGRAIDGASYSDLQLQVAHISRNDHDEKDWTKTSSWECEAIGAVLDLVFEMEKGGYQRTGGWDAKKVKRMEEAKRKKTERIAMLRVAKEALGLVSAPGEAKQDFVFDAGKPAMFIHEACPVFVAVDVENMEGDQGIITEVGMSFFDPHKMKDIAPGMDGESWFDGIVSEHIRVQDYLWHRNSRFSDGCPELFNFGFVAPPSLLTQA